MGGTLTRDALVVVQTAAALVLLVGAEINSEMDCALRSAACVREKPPPPAETVDTEPATETPSTSASKP